MCDRSNIKTYHRRISDYRFHFFDIFLHFSHTVTIEPQFIHRFQHAGMYEITLETDMIVVTV